MWKCAKAIQFPGWSYWVKFIVYCICIHHVFIVIITRNPISVLLQSSGSDASIEYASPLSGKSMRHIVKTSSFEVFIFYFTSYIEFLFYKKCSQLAISYPKSDIPTPPNPKTPFGPFALSLSSCLLIVYHGRRRTGNSKFQSFKFQVTNILYPISYIPYPSILCGGVTIPAAGPAQLASLRACQHDVLSLLEFIVASRFRSFVVLYPSWVSSGAFLYPRFCSLLYQFAFFFCDYTIDGTLLLEYRRPT